MIKVVCAALEASSSRCGAWNAHGPPVLKSMCGRVEKDAHPLSYSVSYEKEVLPCSHCPHPEDDSPS